VRTRAHSHPRAPSRQRPTGQRVSVVSTASFVNPETGVRTYGASASKAYKERPNGTFTAAVNEGESYVFQNGAWQDWSDFLDKADTGEFVVDNFSIKLYATPGDPDSVEEGQGILRLYNPNSGEHFYTSSAEERDQLVDLGWKDEGVGWHSAGDVPMLRQYNPNAASGSHNFMTSEVENDALVRLGWHFEGIGWMAVMAG